MSSCHCSIQSFAKYHIKPEAFERTSHKWTGNVSTSCKVKLCKDQLASETRAAHSTSVNIVFHPRWQATLSSSAFSHIYADASNNLFGKLWGVFQLSMLYWWLDHALQYYKSLTLSQMLVLSAASTTSVGFPETLTWPRHWRTQIPTLGSQARLTCTARIWLNCSRKLLWCCLLLFDVVCGCLWCFFFLHNLDQSYSFGAN